MKKGIEYQKLGELLRKMQEGNMDIFPEFYSRTCNMVFYQIGLLGVPPENAEDVAQEVYINFIKNYEKIENPDAVYKWLKQTAHNVAVNYLKKSVNIHEKVLEEDEEYYFESENNLTNPLPLPEDVMENEASQKIVMDILKELSPVQYKMIVWYYYNEENIKDIAEEMGVPEGTVKTNLFRARKYIKDRVTNIEKTQGIKLYSISVAPVIVLMVEKEIDAVDMNIVVSSKKLIDAVRQNFSAKHMIGRFIHSTAGKAISSRVATKVVTGVLVAGTVIGGGIVSYRYVRTEDCKQTTINENRATETENKKATVNTSTTKKNNTSEKTYEAYRQALYEFVDTNVFPSGKIAAGGISDSTDWGEMLNKPEFVICDVDGDNKDEMIINWCGGDLAAWGDYAFEYDEAQECFNPIFHTDSGTIYPNGIRIAYNLHSYYGGEMAEIFKINDETKQWESIGYYEEILKDCWEQYTFLNDQDISYPEELDTNGEGRIYHIKCEEYDGLYSVKDFKKIEKKLTGGVEPIDTDRKELIKENIDVVIDQKIKEIKN